MKRFAALVIIALAIASRSVSQEPFVPKQAPTAMLALLVTDSQGHHVPALSPEDLQLSIDDKPVSFDRFVERGANGAPAGEMRRIAVLFDVSTLSVGARKQTASALHAFLVRTLRPGDLVVILAGGKSLRAMTTWTASLATVDVALARVCNESSSPLADGQIAAESRIREIATDIQQADASGHTLYTFDALIAAARAFAAARYRDTEQSLDVISLTLSLFTPRTRNVLIIAGGSLPRKPGDGVFQYVETLRTSSLHGARGVAMQTGAQFSSPMGESASFDLTSPLANAATRSWRRGVAIYSISTEMFKDSGGGSETGQSADSLAAFTNEAGRFSGYRMLADATGGIAFVGRAPEDALDHIVRDLEAFYTVGVHPSAPIAGRNVFSVKVARGYSVRILRGSSGSGTPADEMESRVVANHLIRPTDNALGISLNAAPPVSEGEKRLVTVDVVIPIRKLRLVQQGSSVAGAFTVFIATGDTIGNSSGVNRQRKEIHWPSDVLAQAADKSLTFRVNVVLEPGRSQISIGVMDENSHEKGFDRLSV